MTQEKTPPAQPCIFFTRQPVFDAKRSIWGYELLGGEIKEGIFEVFPEKESSASLASSTYLGLREAMERGKKIMVGFDDESILSGMPHALPPSSGAIRVLPRPHHTSGLDTALQKLRGDGYLIVLEAMPGVFLHPELCGLADILVLDLGSIGTAALDSEQQCDGLFLAKGVKTAEQFHGARDRGFSLFQGSFFKEPEVVSDRKLGSHELSRLNLFRLIETEDPDFKALAAAIRSDVSISFRLLSYLNSAWFGLRHSIQSIDQAIMMLGWIKLKSWLRAALLVDIVGRDEAPRELAALSLQRGKFFELLTTDYDYWGFNPSTLFLMGLFSLMDTILGMDMDSVVELLPLDAKLKAALRRDPNNEYRPLFKLMESLEDGDWATLEELTQKLCLDIGRVKDAFSHARDWTVGFFAGKD